MSEMRLNYTCAWCDGSFHDKNPELVVAEAQAVFSEAELEDSVLVCDDCWRSMRSQNPDLDVRYRIQEEAL